MNLITARIDDLESTLKSIAFLALKDYEKYIEVIPWKEIIELKDKIDKLIEEWRLNFGCPNWKS